MKMWDSKNFVTGIIFVALICISLSEELGRLKSADEQPCFEVKDKDLVALDLNFVGSIKRLYYPLMSRYDYYHASHDLLGDDFETTPEGALYYDSCIIWEMQPDGTARSIGFNGRYKDYKMKPLSPNMEKFEFFVADGEGYGGMAWTTLTDNATYWFTPVCSDGNMAWGVGSTVPSLPKATVEKIRDHAASLGFKREYFTELRYDSCNLENDENNEIPEEHEKKSGSTKSKAKGEL